MNKIIVFSLSFLVLAVRADCATPPAAEILEYGIYIGSHDSSIPNSDAPTGNVLIGGSVKLVKQTVEIPARLKTQFGFRCVLHGKAEDRPVKLRLVYLFPQMNDPSSGKKIDMWEADVLARPEDKKLYMLWDFTEAYELVPGKWTFQVFRGQEKILEKKFDVTKPDSK